MVALNFHYSKQDCLRAWRRHFRERMNLPLDIVAVAVVAAIGVWQWSVDGPSVLSVGAVALAGTLALIIAFALYIGPQVAYQRDEKLKRPYRLLFAEDEIKFTTDNLDSKLGWQIYTSVLIDQYSYLLYHGKAQFTIIPKNAFKDDDSRREFEQLLKNKIRTIVQR
jgi:hypothetical protein